MVHIRQMTEEIDVPDELLEGDWESLEKYLIEALGLQKDERKATA